MINKKVLCYGTKKEHIPLKITIEYEWINDNDEFVDKLVSKLPKFIEKQARRIKNGRTKKVFNR